MIDKAQASICQYAVQEGVSVILDTAGGETKSNEVLPCYLKRLGEHIAPHVLTSTPNVLSLGRRCVQDGYGFYWEPYSMHPYFIHPKTLEKII